MLSELFVGVRVSFLPRILYIGTAEQGVRYIYMIKIRLFYNTSAQHMSWYCYPFKALTGNVWENLEKRCVSIIDSQLRQKKEIRRHRIEP